LATFLLPFFLTSFHFLSFNCSFIYRIYDYILIHSFLGAFAKLRKATISFVMSICPSVRMEQPGSHWTDFHEISYLSIFRTSVGNIQASLSLTRKTGTLQEDQCTFIIIPRPVFLRHVSDKSCREKRKTYFTSNNFFPPESRAFVERYAKARQAIDDNTAHAI
jgi:hypothetical protein